MTRVNRQDLKTFTSLLAQYPAAIRTVAKAARAYILRALPEAYEIVWPAGKVAGYGTGPKKMTEHFAWLAPFSKHVVFGLNYGGELPDPKGLLEGTGAKMRHMKLHTTADLKTPGLDKLLRAALEHRVPPLRDDADDDLRAARKAALAVPAKKVPARKRSR